MKSEKYLSDSLDRATMRITGFGISDGGAKILIIQSGKGRDITYVACYYLKEYPCRKVKDNYFKMNTGTKLVGVRI